MTIITTPKKTFWAIFSLCWISFFWGTTWVASKIGVQEMPALQMVAIRQFLGGIAYLSYFIYKGEKWPVGKQWWPIIWLMVLNFLLSNGLSTWGVSYISSGLGAIIGAAFPLWVVIIYLLQGEKTPTKAIMGMLVGFGGICIVFYDYISDFMKADFRFGIFLSVLATVTWAMASVYTKKQAVHFNPYFSLGLQMMLSSVLTYSFAFSQHMVIPLNEISNTAWWSIAYLVVFGSILTFIAFIYALQNLPTSVSSLYAYINPIVALGLGILFFKEPLTPYIIIGGIVVLIGLYIVNTSLKKNQS